MSELRVDIDAKAYGEGALILEDLHFTIGDGQIAALLGPSGVGKTTLLKMLAGLEGRYNGRIEYGARNGVDQRIGMVFQEPRLLPWLSVRDNVTLVLSDSADDADWVDELLAAVQLSQSANTLPNQLSGGMQRRVALARAFAVRPHLLLLDEPFVSLDPPTAGELRRYLLQLWRTLHPTVVLVSHDIEDAITLADRLLFLSSGPARVLIDQHLPSPHDPASLHRRRHKVEQLMADHPELLAGAWRVHEPPYVEETG